MNSLNERVATYVRSRAGAKGYSTHSLALAAELPVSSVRRYFWTGEAAIPLLAVRDVAAVFGETTSEMLRHAEATEPEPFIEPTRREPKTTARGFVGKKPQVEARKLRSTR